MLWRTTFISLVFFSRILAGFSPALAQESSIHCNDDLNTAIYQSFRENLKTIPFVLDVNHRYSNGSDDLSEALVKLKEQYDTFYVNDDPDTTLSIDPVGRGVGIRLEKKF